MGNRSHHGCARCKRRRNKCDEGRPSCRRCFEAGAACEYLVELKWNGRVPRQQIARPIESWPSTDRLLMSHFINYTSHIIPHRYMRDQTCRDLVPLATERPALRYAIMAMSAIHRNEVSEQFLTRSLHHLQQDLFNQDDSVLQTIKTLCICEIYSGRADSAWRTHVAGAAAMVGSRTGIIRQWYQSMEALTALTNRGPLNDDEVRPIVVRETILDLYSGYTPDLNDVFRQIGRGHASSDTVYEMIARDQKELRFPADVQLDKDDLRQYAACNTAYQHCALIHIYRKLENYDPTSPEVQYCVRTILDTVCAILPMNALSPWALLTTPIFTAGCEAVGDDRDLVRTLLNGLYSTLRIKNILRALDILEHQWSSKHAEIESLDFIPY